MARSRSFRRTRRQRGGEQWKAARSHPGLKAEAEANMKRQQEIDDACKLCSEANPSFTESVSKMMGISGGRRRRRRSTRRRRGCGKSGAHSGGRRYRKSRSTRRR